MNRILLGIALLLACTAASAKLSIKQPYSDGMVLQQNAAAAVKGFATPGSQISVTTSWDGRNYRTRTGADGIWTVKVGTPAASYRSYSLKVSGDGGSLTQRPGETLSAARPAFRQNRIVRHGRDLLLPRGMVIRIDDQFQTVMLRQLTHTDKPFLEFFCRNDIGIGIIQRDLPPFRLQPFDTRGRARRTADMQKQGRAGHGHFSGFIPANGASSSGVNGR